MYYGRWSWERVGIESLKDKTVTKIEKNCNDELWFTTSDGQRYLMFHDQDCCESVSIEEIHGDLADLIGTPILMAEEVSEDGLSTDWGTSTWTFYKLATVKGYVTIRWYGESNGYYSERVDFVLVPEDAENN